MRWLLAALALAAPLSAQTITARVEGVSGTATVRVLAPPAGDAGGDSLPVRMAPLAVPRDSSPHFDHLMPTMTDFCYCWDGAAGDSARRWAARHFDLIMSGNLKLWRALNPTAILLRYSLMQSSFSEEPDTTTKHTVDANSLTGKWQYDARSWFAAHPQYSYESMWLHDRSDSTPADSAHRVRRIIWNNFRYAINPMDAGARAYTIDRLRRVRWDIPEASGLFLDEMDHHALSWYKYAREGVGIDSLVWQDSMASLVRAIRDSLAPAVIQTNAAAYSTAPFDRAVGVAAGSMHLEQLNKVTQEMPSVWSFVEGLLKDSVLVDWVNLEAFTDFLRPSMLVSYPKGNYDSGADRAMVVQLASYYMVVPTDAHRLGFHLVGAKYGITPDSLWLPIYQFDVGDPLGPRTLYVDARDALKQRARVYRRDFTHAVVLTRPVAYWDDTKMTDTTAVAVPLPDGGPWDMVTARGELRARDSLELRNSEAVILVRRP